MAAKVRREPTAMIFIDKSFCVRGTAVSFFPLPFISCAARPTAPMMILRLLKMPMIPAMAIPPIPMLLAYWKICSALAWEAVTKELPVLTTRSGNNHEMAGTITHHTATEPQQMMSAYFKPTMYPIPSTAAPVLILKTSLVLSAKTCPHSKQRDVTLSFHQPTVAMMKS